jgi:hypothetical protein
VVFPPPPYGASVGRAAELLDDRVRPTPGLRAIGLIEFTLTGPLLQRPRHQVGVLEGAPDLAQLGPGGEYLDELPSGDCARRQDDHGAKPCPCRMRGRQAAVLPSGADDARPFERAASAMPRP